MPKKLILTLTMLLLTLSLISCTDTNTEKTATNNTKNNTQFNTNNNNSELKLTADLLTELTTSIEETMATDGIAGAAVALVEGNETIFAKGFGWRDVAAQKPVTPETLFHIGSTNKSFTSMMIATLADDGLIEWNAPVTEIYPDFQLSDSEATENVTIRHLLSMQSGIPDYAEEDFDLENATAEDVFYFLADTPLLDTPGQEFSYSNLSYAAAGYLGVLATDPNSNDLYTGYANLLEERVLDPIGMKNAVINVSEARKNPNYGKSYLLDDDGNPIETEAEDFDGDPLAPSGIIKANILDMALYISTQLNSGVAPNGNRIVSKQNLSQTWQPSLENYAMGWQVDEYENVTIISHEGSFDNYLSIIGFLPEYNIGFVVLSNTADASETLISESPYLLVDLLLAQ